MDRQDRVKFMISIDSYRRVQDKGEEYVVYEIKLKSNRTEYGDVTVYRRFNQFLSLYTKLTEETEAKAWPKFPKKSYFGRFNGDVLAERLECFTEILAVISHDHKLQMHPEVKNFLDPSFEYK